MSRLSVLLLILLMGSSLYLVRVQYESRALTTQLDRARSDAHRLDLEHDRLDVERRAQATPLRVEKFAKDQLHMKTVSPAITQYAHASELTSSDVVPSAKGGQQP
jgi:cell division protein FtsL